MNWQERFEQFVARKEREAREAAIEPFSTELFHPSSDLTAIETPWSRARFDGPFLLSPPSADDLPATGLVFVQSRDGNTVAKNPSMLGGGLADKHLIYEGLSRVAADAIVAGAETVRGTSMMFSVWHPEMVALRARLGLPRHPVQVIATLRGVDFDEALVYNVPSLRVVIMTVPPCAQVMQQGLSARPWIETLLMRDSHDLADTFRELRRLGIARVSAVGGRTVATALVDAGLVDDLYLTTTPIEAGQPNTPFYPHPLAADVVVRKRGTGADAGVVFEHKVRLRPNGHGR